MKPKKLPDKLSDLLELAVKDAKRAERSKKYVLDMYKFHAPKGEPLQGCDCEDCRDAREKPNRCRVCMAGAVIAFELGGPPDQFALRRGFPDLEGKLLAIDSMRRGAFGEAKRRAGLRGRVPRGLPKEGDRDYDSTKFRFPWARYLDAAAKLREAGL